MTDPMKKIKSETAAMFIGTSMDHFHFGDDESHPECLRLKDSLRSTIGTLYRETGVNQYLCGVTPGAEMWAAEIVLESMKDHPDMELYCLIPTDNPANAISPILKKRMDHIIRNSTALLSSKDELCNPEHDTAGSASLIDYTSVLIVVSEIQSVHPEMPPQVIQAWKKGNRVVFIA